jgi:hypothetical protein
MKFEVSHKAGVIEALFALEALAIKTGTEHSYRDALKQISAHFQSDPLEWGDPTYRLLHEGGIICHRIVNPLVVRFAVYEVEQKVYILEIKSASPSLSVGE